MRVKPSELKLSADTMLRLKYLAAKGLPYEVGGVIDKNGCVIQYPNVADDREHSFDMDIDLDMDIIAIWHSHPTGPEDVSHDDVECMYEGYELGYEWPWIIVSPNTITRWEIDVSASAA